MKLCVIYFTLLACIALVGGILYIFAIVPDYQPIIQWVVVFIAIFGNCLGSCAVHYSGSFKQEVKSLGKGVKRLQFASDQLREHVEAMMRHRGAITRTHEVLDTEIGKLREDVLKFEENEKVIDATAINIEDNAKTLSTENYKFSREQKELTKEEKQYSKTVDTMASNKDNLKKYNEEAQDRVGHLTMLVESLKECVPELDEQLDKFNGLRKNVEDVSAEMGGDVDNTTATVNTIFNEIKELTIRQERIMLYQLLERIFSTTRSRDEMNIDAFNRFLAQIPETYNGHTFDERWFNRVALHGQVSRTDLKFLIDKITLNKITDEQ